MSEPVFNSSNALMQMDWLTLAPMPVLKWWRKVSRHEHASLVTNGYIVTRPYNDVWHVKITQKGKARLEQ
jgi:hypothetical protein